MAERKTSSPMATEEMSGAWRELPWRKLEQHVYRMQKRIYRASQRGNTTTSREAAKVAAEIGSSTPVGSAAGDARQPRQENGGRRRGQIRPTQRTNAYGQTASHETLETPQNTTTCSQSVDTKARKSRTKTTGYSNHNGTREASPGEVSPRASVGSSV